MSDIELKEITAAIATFDNAMLVTERDGALRSRPMSIGDCTADGRIRFITSDDSEKVSEITEDHDVNVSLQGQSKFLSISGKARLTKDDDLIKKTWDKSQSPWISDGPDDPHAIVLEVVPTYVEYWDRTGPSLLRSVFDQTSGAAADKHKELDLSGKPV